MTDQPEVQVDRIGSKSGAPLHLMVQEIPVSLLTDVAQTVLEREVAP